ncbi:MAG: hypothetical protein V1708_00355 [Candidatus Micrarchaeota archaeon]
MGIKIEGIDSKSALYSSASGLTVLAAFGVFLFTTLMTVLRGGCLPGYWYPFAIIAIPFLIYVGNSQKLGSMQLDWKTKISILLIVLAALVVLLLLLYPSSYCAHMYAQSNSLYISNSMTASNALP